MCIRDSINAEYMGDMMGTRDQHPNTNFVYKVVLIGDSNVGKTTLLSRYILNISPKKKAPTIGVEMSTSIFELRDGNSIKVQLYDTSGFEKYRSVTTAHYRKAIGGLVVFDVTKRTTFEHAENWVKELRAQAEPNIVIMLVGNKLDLCEPAEESKAVPRAVSTEEAAKFADRYHLEYTETSAMAGTNVQDAFQNLMQKIYDEEFEDLKRSKESNIMTEYRSKKATMVLTPSQTSSGSLCC
eukprot:TRINITY_DN5331_c0_g1_i1.p1 TRINITY_DN5331_c0_g1~~TRINITY_DN5331_c0_g1_i1.p1  ORF type:complete len:240 (-),score=30.07 TRINITY_DN5331_c0_g1_i1:64-783(-)